MNTTLEETGPVWQYEADGNAISEILGMQLILWSKGMCAVGYNTEGIPQKVKTYLFPKNWDAIYIEYVFTNEPLFAGPEAFTHIWLTEERNILVPEQLYMKDYADEWIRKFHFLEKDEVLFNDDLKPALDAQMVFPVQEKLKELLEMYMGDAKISTLSKMALRTPAPSAENLIEIINLPKTALLSLQENGKYILHQVCSYEKTEDILYKIAIILQEKDLRQDEINLTLFGIAPFWNNIIEELQTYFSFTEALEDTTRVTIDFLKELYLCAS